MWLDEGGRTIRGLLVKRLFAPSRRVMVARRGCVCGRTISFETATTIATKATGELID
jgi:hypothetical protein